MSIDYGDSLSDKLVPGDPLGQEQNRAGPELTPNKIFIYILVAKPILLLLARAIGSCAPMTLAKKYAR